MSNKKDIWLISAFSAFIASLCCFSPIILVLLGLSSLTTAAALGNYLFFAYWWLFISGGLLLMAIIFWIYFRKKHNICNFNDIKTNRRKIINTLLLAFISFFVLYIVFEVALEIVWLLMGMTSLEELKGYFF